MKINADTAISTSTVLLVPYDPHHVDTYHQWMSDPQIQHLTASEPLTLAAEHANQGEWRASHDKLTFIVCLPLPASASPTQHLEKVQACRDDTPERMLGDINLILHQLDDDDNNNAEVGAEAGVHDADVGTKVQRLAAEIDVMIAAPANRGRGRGRAAVEALLQYVQRHAEALTNEYAAFIYDNGDRVCAAKLGDWGQGEKRKEKFVFSRLMAKIQEDNLPSRRLFETLGFEVRGDGKPNVFGEVEMVMSWQVLLELKHQEMESDDNKYRELLYTRDLK